MVLAKVKKTEFPVFTYIDNDKIELTDNEIFIEIQSLKKL